MKISTYNLTSGRLRKQITQSDVQPINIKSTEGYVAGHYDGNLYYVDITHNPVVVMHRSDFNTSINKTIVTADGVDECIVVGIPNNTTCTIIKGHELILDEDITDGTIELSSLQTGWYKITLTHLHYITEVIEVTTV